MARNSKMIDLLVERHLTDSDTQFRNRELKARLDKIGRMLNAQKAAWNAVNETPADQITESDYKFAESE